MIFIPPPHENTRKPTDPGQVARLLQIIGFALVAGCVAFGAFAISHADFQKPAENRFLSYGAAGYAALATVLSIVIPGIVAQSSTRAANGDVSIWLQAYSVKTIIGLALLEGANLFVIFTIMSQSHWWSVVVAAAVLALMISRIPSRMRIEEWLVENGCEIPRPPDF